MSGAARPPATVSGDNPTEQGLKRNGVVDTDDRPMQVSGDNPTEQGLKRGLALGDLHGPNPSQGIIQQNKD